MWRESKFEENRLKSWKGKILAPIILVTLLFCAKWIAYDYVLSDGKRVGNLTKISKLGKTFLTKTWEGTIDEGSGDKLTTNFSVKSDEIGQELYAYEGREVILYYEVHFMGWPRLTNYDIVSWKPKKIAEKVDIVNQENDNSSSEAAAARELSKSLLCSFLGSLYTNQDLYQDVKAHIKKTNLYLFNQYQRCNE